MSRKTTYTDEIAMHITSELIEGRSLRSICREDPGMPDRVTVIRWLAKEEYAEFRNQYALARMAQADILADEIIEIADTPLQGDEVTIKPDGSKEVRTGDMLGHRKLQIDARKWYASKLAPKKYGDALEVKADLPLVIFKDYTGKKRPA
jgi:hypothetical protein